MLETQGDYMRCAIDLFPTRGKLQQSHSIGELTIHRIHPTATDLEVISYSALATAQDYLRSSWRLMEGVS